MGYDGDRLDAPEVPGDPACDALVAGLHTPGLRIVAGELKSWELTFRIHQRYGHESPLTGRLAALDDEYVILEYDDRTVDQVDDEHQ
ncbi:hypothetical protein [Streptomyces exfoliatus]|uniref:hypothetical protein n=1 Tax=Streptomyces exfoliatus TaxID=1905 RepID=UPI003C2BB954